MVNTAIVPATERKLKKYVNIGFAIRNTFTFAYRSLLKAIHNPDSFLDVTIMPIISTLLFTYMFGGAIAGSVENYLPIVIPAVLILLVAINCATAGEQLREDTDKNISKRFKSMPISRIAPLAGILIADLVRYAITGIVVFTVGGIIGYRPEAGILAVIAGIAFVMLIAWCLSWMSAFVFLTVKSSSTASALSMMVMFMLVFLSNAFVSSKTLPGWLRFFVDHMNPLSKAVTAVRQILNQGTLGTNFWLALAGASIILIVFIPLTLRVYKRKV